MITVFSDLDRIFGSGFGSGFGSRCREGRVPQANARACGGAGRTRGVGIHTTHGHFGRLVFGRDGSLVVRRPRSERPVHRRRLFFGGPRSWAALMPWNVPGPLRPCTSPEPCPVPVARDAHATPRFRPPAPHKPLGTSDGRSNRPPDPRFPACVCGRDPKQDIPRSMDTQASWSCPTVAPATIEGAE